MTDTIAFVMPDFLSIIDPRSPGTPRPVAVEVTGIKPSHTATLPSRIENTPVNLGGPKIGPQINLSQPKSGAPKIEIPGGSVTAPPPPTIPDMPAMVRPLPGGIPLNLVPSPDVLNMAGGFQAAIGIDEEPDFLALEDPKERVFLRVLEKSGLLSRAAETAGLDIGRVRRRMQKDPRFCELIDMAIAYRREIIVDEAMRRAVHGIDEPIYYMGAICGYKRVYSDSLLSKLMEGYDPEKFRANHKVTVEGNIGVATMILPALASSDEWAKLNRGRVIDVLPDKANPGGDDDFGDSGGE
jgi:hypothetical protein